MSCGADAVDAIEQLDVPHILCCLINSRSGGKAGQRVLESLRGKPDSCFGEKRIVFDLKDFIGFPEEAIESLRSSFAFQDEKLERDSPIRRFLIVGGGDGTMKWAMEILAKVNPPTDQVPALALIPLGTANELSRVSGWNAFRTRFNVSKYVQSVIRGPIVPIDNWKVEIAPREGESKSFSMICFMSIGIDAKVAAKFHKTREAASPFWTGSVIRNKLVYVYFGLKRLVSKHCALASRIDLKVDSTPTEFPASLQSIQVFNVCTAADGIYFWGTGRSTRDELQDYKDPALSDGFLEVCGLKNMMSVSTAKVQLAHSFRIAQATDVEFDVKAPKLVIQIDGEAWYLEEGSKVHVSSAGKIPLVTGPGRTFHLVPRE